MQICCETRFFGVSQGLFLVTVKTEYVNDGSVEFHYYYNELDHQDSEEVTYKCPKCFVQSTMRSRYMNLWEPGQVVPDYF